MTKTESEIEQHSGQPDARRQPHADHRDQERQATRGEPEVQVVDLHCSPPRPDSPPILSSDVGPAVPDVTTPAPLSWSRCAGKSGRRSTTCDREEPLTWPSAQHSSLRSPPVNGHSSLTSCAKKPSGGALLLIAATAGLIAANTSLSDDYESLKNFAFGPERLHLHLTMQEWAADGLLAIFFFVAGVELKRELVVGSLRKLNQAVLPVIAALAGMVVPAAIYLATAGGTSTARDGWAIPMATDIAFALAVLAVVGSHLPPALRAFLLTLAVVDDLGAIAVIALFFTESIDFVALTIAAVLLVVYALLQRARVTSTWLYVPIALAIWTAMHDSGVHATVAGVLLGSAHQGQAGR